MQQVVDGCSFDDWWQQFQPGSDGRANWLQPARVSDASDPRIVHLHGVNLARTWCWAWLRTAIPDDLHPAIDAAIDAHLAASLSPATAGDYVGTHWLASFALLALDERPVASPVSDLTSAAVRACSLCWTVRGQEQGLADGLRSRLFTHPVVLPTRRKR
jgi:hypothetical protein